MLRHPQDREILRLAVPALGSLVAEPLLLLADSAIVGHLGTPQLGGLGVAGAILATIVYLCVFLAYGTTSAVARQIGAGNLDAAVRQGIDGMWLGAGLGVAILLVGAPLAPRIVHAFGASDAVTPYAVTYLRVSLAGVPAMLVVLAGTGVLRGLQNTATPLVVAVGGSAANVVLNVLLVYPAGLGIAGSALGTVLAQCGMAAAYVVIAARAARRQRIPVRPDWAGVRASATAGVPLLVRTLTLRVVLLLATAVASRLGDTALAAHQVAFNLWTFLAMILDAVAIAGQAIVGHSLGAGDVAGTRAATRRMVEWGLAVGMVLGVVFAAGRALYIPLFTPDTAVRDLLAGVMLIVAAAQPLAGVVFVLDGVLIGAGDARYLAAAGAGTMLAFFAAVAVGWASGGGLPALWGAMVVFMLARLAFLGLRARGTAWMVTGAVRART